MGISVDQVVELLGSGLTQEQVATAVGCEQAAISRLLAEPEVNARVTELRMSALTSHNERDHSIDEIEDKLISKLNDTVDHIFKPRDLLAAFRIVNAAKRRGLSVAPTTIGSKTVVNLTLPTVIINKFIRNSKGEVISVDGQTLISMPARQLLSNLASKNKSEDGKENAYEKAAKFLPNNSRELTEDDL
jgi:hypothetical protein